MVDNLNPSHHTYVCTYYSLKYVALLYGGRWDIAAGSWSPGWTGVVDVSTREATGSTEVVESTVSSAGIDVSTTRSSGDEPGC